MSAQKPVDPRVVWAELYPPVWPAEHAPPLMPTEDEIAAARAKRPTVSDWLRTMKRGAL